MLQQSIRLASNYGACRYKEHFILDTYKTTKRLVLEHQLDKEFSKASKRSFFKNDNRGLEDFLDCYGEEAYRVAKNLCNSRYRKAKKARCKIGHSVVKGNAYFVTLTFKDEVLDKTSRKTRRRYVSRFLKELCDKYVGNIDFGSKGEREHYHALVEPYWWMFDTYKNGKKLYEDMPDFRKWNKYGYFSIEKVGNTDDDLKKVSKYTAKLSAHAIKETTLKGESVPRLLYSRRRLIIKSLPYLPKRSTNAK